MVFGKWKCSLNLWIEVHTGSPHGKKFRCHCCIKNRSYRFSVLKVLAEPKWHTLRQQMHVTAYFMATSFNDWSYLICKSHITLQKLGHRTVNAVHSQLSSHDQVFLSLLHHSKNYEVFNFLDASYKQQCSLTFRSEVLLKLLTENKLHENQFIENDIREVLKFSATFQKYRYDIAWLEKHFTYCIFIRFHSDHYIMLIVVSLWSFNNSSKSKVENSGGVPEIVPQRRQSRDVKFHLYVCAISQHLRLLKCYPGWIHSVLWTKIHSEPTIYFEQTTRWIFYFWHLGNK